MNNARRVMSKTIGLLFGLFGLGLIIQWLIMLPGIKWGPEWTGVVFAIAIVSTFLLIGSIFAWVGFRVVFRYSENTVKKLCVLGGVTAYSFIGHALRAWCDAHWSIKEIDKEAVLFSLPILLAVLVYKVALYVLQEKPVAEEA